MLTLTLLSLAIFVIYLTLFLRYAGEMPKSLSETYYYLGSVGYPEAGWRSDFSRLRASIFTAMMWAIAFLLIAPMMDVTPDGLQFLVFLSLAGICFVGAAPEFKEIYEGKVHTASAVIAAVCALAWVVFVAGGVIPIVVSLLFSLCGAIATSTLVRSRTFWLELVAFNSVYLSLIFMM